MKCTNLSEQYSCYIDKECSPEMIDVINQHLSQCSKCAEEIETLRLIKSALKVLPRIEPSESYFSAFDKKRAELKKSVNSSSSTIVPFYTKSLGKIAYAAVAAVILLVSFMWFTHNETAVTPEPLITYMRGKVMISEDDQAPELAFLKKAITGGQIIETGPFAKLDFEVYRKCRISLSENSALRIESINVENDRLILHCSLEKGTILAHVVKSKDQADVLVETELVDVKVVGTKFMVQSNTGAQEGNVCVAVLEGVVATTTKVSVDSSIPETLNIFANQKMIFDVNGRAKLQKQLSAADFQTLYDIYSIGKRTKHIEHQNQYSDQDVPINSHSKLN
ncbi:MAG: FecR domain-containing protein [Candidatus Auribacterota bacterium]